MRKRMIVMGGLILIGGALWGAFRVWDQSIPLVTSESFIFEYGEPVHLLKADLIDTDDSAILDSMVIDTASLVYQKNQSYPEVGVYRIPITYQTLWIERSGVVSVTVRDTVSPVFTKHKDQYTFDEGEANDQYDFLRDFEVSDLSDTIMHVSVQDIDFKHAGTYQGTVTASDIHENKQEMTFSVTINKPVIVEAEVKPPVNSNPVVKCPNTPNTVKAPFSVNGILVVNKKNPLPKSYAPGENAKAGQMIRAMIGDMQGAGLNISSNYSGYRSYDYQSKLYNNYVSSTGKREAERFSARPGYSEHQTGLAFDLKHKNGSLVEGATEAAWIAQHAHEYGFIVRYPSGMESITGYIYEPWHLRYIGEEATQIYESGLTLEAYLNIAGGGYCD